MDGRRPGGSGLSHDRGALKASVGKLALGSERVGSGVKASLGGGWWGPMAGFSPTPPVIILPRKVARLGERAYSYLRARRFVGPWSGGRRALRRRPALGMETEGSRQSASLASSLGCWTEAVLSRTRLLPVLKSGQWDGPADGVSTASCTSQDGGTKTGMMLRKPAWLRLQCSTAAPCPSRARLRSPRSSAPSRPRVRKAPSRSRRDR